MWTAILVIYFFVTFFSNLRGSSILDTWEGNKLKFYRISCGALLGVNVKAVKQFWLLKYQARQGEGLMTMAVPWKKGLPWPALTSWDYSCVIPMAVTRRRVLETLESRRGGGLSSSLCPSQINLCMYGLQLDCFPPLFLWVAAFQADIYCLNNHCKVSVTFFLSGLCLFLLHILWILLWRSNYCFPCGLFCCAEYQNMGFSQWVCKTTRWDEHLRWTSVH